jgi:hypothetical protein
MMETGQFGNKPASRDEQAALMNASRSPEQDSVLEQALKDFRSSVHAWSEAAYKQPRSAERIVPQRSWRPAASWVLGCALLAGCVTGGVVEQHRQQEAARIAAAQQARQQQMEAQARARQKDRNLMATVDSDISQEVPTAMEPLAQMMEDGGTQ